MGPALATGLGARGHVAAPVRLADADVAALLRAGDLVDVVLAGGADSKAVSASVVAPSARVVTVVNAGSDDALRGDVRSDGWRPGRARRTPQPGSRPRPRGGGRPAVGAAASAERVALDR